VPRAEPPDRLIWSRDPLLLPYFLAVGLVAWFTPERMWPMFCRLPERITRHGRSDKGKLAKLARVVGPGLADRTSVIWRDLRANAHIRNAQYLRTFRPGGWQPRLRLEGRAFIDAALSEGRGVILWVAPMVFSNLVTKMTLAQEGIHASHLSMSTHGFSASRFGVRFLNRLATSAEERFVTERLVMFRGARNDALKELTRRVQAGRVVTITANAAAATAAISTPLLGGTFVLATGPPSLARHTGASLLPVFTVRMPDGSFVTRIEAPLARSGEGRKDALRSAVSAYVSLLETYVARWPEQYPNFFGAARGRESAAVSD
jgi:lauroyl/myristoyl acyltransferase